MLGYTEAANAHAGEIVVGRVGSVGSIRLLEGDAWATDNTLIVSLDLRRVEPRFALHALRQIPISKISSGTAMPLVTASNLLRQAIFLPSLHEQCAIAEYIAVETASIDRLIEHQQVLLILLEERRIAVIGEPFERAASSVPLGTALEHVIDHRGKTPAKVGSKGDDFVEEGVPVVSAVNIKNGQVSWKERERYVTHSMFEKWMPVQLRAGDVLLTSEAPLGRVAQVPSDAPLVLSQRLFALRGRAEVLNSTYLRFFLESARGQFLLRDGASGSTVSGIRQSRLTQIAVPMVPLAEQRQVVHEISAQLEEIDALIDETRRFVELSTERRSALVRATVTGGIDAREMA